MARLFDDGSSEYGVALAAPVSVEPFTLACWAWSDDLTIGQTPLALGGSGGTPLYEIHWAGNQADDLIRAWARDDASASGYAKTATGYSANTWHHTCAVFAATNARYSYIDGGSKGTNVTGLGACTLDRSAVGCLYRGSAAVFFSGVVAWASIWNAALNDAEVAILASGVLPWKIRPANLLACWPLWGLHSPEIDLLGTYNLTLTGTVRADGPPVAPFSSRFWGGIPTWAAAAPPGLDYMPIRMPESQPMVQPTEVVAI